MSLAVDQLPQCITLVRLLRRISWHRRRIHSDGTKSKSQLAEVKCISILCFIMLS